MGEKTPTPKNILYIIGSLNQGGAERVLVELAKGLDKSLFRPFILIYHDKIHYKEILDRKDISLTLIKKSFQLSPLFLFRVVNFIKKNRIDLIDSFTHNTGFWGRLAGFLTGVPNITRLRNSGYSKSWFLYEKAMGWMDKFMLVNSISVRDEYLKEIPGKKNIEVIYQGVYEERFPKKDSFTPGPVRKIITAGRISPAKNHICLLKALNILKEKNSFPFQCQIWGRKGDEKLFYQLNNYIKEKGMEEIVQFMGTTENIYDPMIKADLFVLSSIREGLPNVVMEAMACGLPVISADVSDTKYLVLDGKTGFLFPPDDYVRLAELIERYFSLSEEQVRKISAEGIDHIKNNFSQSSHIIKTQEIYHRILIGM